VQNYRTKHETITVDNIDYSIQSLKDRQQYDEHDQLALDTGISSASWPLFGIVWPASRILAATVSALVLDDIRVLEIGCGIALSSIVLHQMGVDITASDYHPLARKFLDNNIQNNNLSPIKYKTGNWEKTNPQLGEFDLIIGSDVLYEPAHAGLVADFIDCHSSHSVEVIIVDPNRSNRARFTKNMQAHGYAHHFTRFNIAEPETSRCKGRVLHFHRKNEQQKPELTLV